MLAAGLCFVRTTHAACAVVPDRPETIRACVNRCRSSLQTSHPAGLHMMRNGAVAASCPNFVYIFFVFSGVHASLWSISVSRAVNFTRRRGGGGRRRVASRPARAQGSGASPRADRNDVHGSARHRSHSRIHSRANPSNAPRAGARTGYSSHVSQSSDAPSLHAVETRQGDEDATRTPASSAHT